jgi:hypothetical protein
MSENDCPEATALALLTLGPDEGDPTVRAHLGGCPACREKLLALGELLALPSTQEPPPSVLPALLRRIDAQLAKDAGKELPPKKRKSPMRVPTKTPTAKKLRTPSSTKGKTPSNGKSRSAAPATPVAPAHPLRSVAIAAALVLVSIGVGSAILLAGKGSSPETAIARVDKPDGASSVVVVTPVGPGSGEAGERPQRPDEQKEREELEERAGEIVGLAKGDEFMRAKALKMLSVLRTSASPRNRDIVEKTEARVKELIEVAQRSAAHDVPSTPTGPSEKPGGGDGKFAPEPDAGHKEEVTPEGVTATAAEPAPPPNPSLLAYADLRKKLFPALASFTLEAAKRILEAAPELEGTPAKDLEADRAALAILEKFLEFAGSTKAWKDLIELDHQTFVLKDGTKITGTLKSVRDGTLTIAMDVGGLQEVKVSELAFKDLCAYARKGCPKEERATCFLGWGIAAYYAGDLDLAKGKFDEAAKEDAAKADSLGSRFVARIVRDRIAASATPAPNELALNPKKETKPVEPPAPPAAGKGEVEVGPPGFGPAELAALKDTLHGAAVTTDGSQVVVSYDMKTDALKDDFTVQGNATLGRSDAYTGNWGLYFGVSSSDHMSANHVLSWKGDFDWTIEFMLNSSITSDRVVQFMVDFWDGPKERGLFSAFGQTLGTFDVAKHTSTPVGGEVDLKSFGAERRNTVRFVRKGDEFTLYFNGGKRASTKMAGGEARFIVTSACLPFWLTRLEMKGLPDLSKLKK